MTTLTAFVEDTIAVIGALAGITLSHLTENSIYDATAALAIGGLLMIGTVGLAWVNKRLLVGKSLLPAEDGARFNEHGEPDHDEHTDREPERRRWGKAEYRRRETRVQQVNPHDHDGDHVGNPADKGLRRG